jgi:hypothetical protein
MKKLLAVFALGLAVCVHAPAQNPPANKPVNQPANKGDLQPRVERLDETVRRAEAVRAVKRLQYAYGQYAEFGMWNDLADLFSDRGLDHFPSGSLGKEGIRKSFFESMGKGKLGLPEGALYPHFIMEPVVTLAPDGKSAKGRWRALIVVGAYGSAAIWAGGIYENEYVLENGVWKIEDFHYYPQYSGAYEQFGWTVDKDRGSVPIHYDPARAGNPIALDKEVSPQSKLVPQPAELKVELADLFRRAQRLNDENEVENLQNSYGYYVDRKMWDDVADLFAPDATMELGLQGVYAGKSSIRHALDQFGPSLREGELNDHLQLETIVDIAPDDLSAKARGVELVMAGKAGVSGEWAEGVFENEYRKRNGVWRIQTMHVYPRLLADYDKGWAKDAKSAPGPSREYPPDRPPTVTYGTFPKFHIPPFHYNHPVTARPPQYPEGQHEPPPQQAQESRSPASPGGSVHAATEHTKSLAELVSETERRVQRAIAYDAAENLVSAYGYYLDEAMWDETANLFARDGWREQPFVGTYVGRERIRQAMKLSYPGPKSNDYLTVHQLTQPVIHVSPDGQSANLRVRLFQLAGASGGNGLWLTGIYEDKAAVEDGVWKITAQDLQYVWSADAKGGWAHAAGTFHGLPDRVSAQLPPDRPLRGPAAPPFPKIVDVPFHYVNPVSGRKPPLLLP